MLLLLGSMGISDKVKVITGNGEPPVSDADGTPEGPAPLSAHGVVLAKGPPGLTDIGHGLEEGELGWAPWPPAEKGDQGPLDRDPDGPPPFGLPEEVLGLPADPGHGPVDGAPGWPP